VCELKGVHDTNGFLSAKQAFFLLQKLCHLELAGNSFEADQCRQTKRHLGVQHETTDVHDDANVDGGARDDGLHRHLLHDGNAVERALGLQRADTNLELTIFNPLDDVGDVADCIWTFEQVDHSSCLSVGATQPVTLRCDDLRRQRVWIGLNKQVTRIRRGDFGDVELFVERLADTIENGESSLFVAKKKSIWSVCINRCIARLFRSIVSLLRETTLL